MYKFLIDNEEILCNQTITINENFLKSSNVIIENCYPKSWENDKDYVSRFYFPKDYSKFKVIDNTISTLPEEYEELEYIESIDGKQYINTNQGWNYDEFKIKFSVNYNASQNFEEYPKSIMGAQDLNLEPVPEPNVPITAVALSFDPGIGFVNYENYTSRFNYSRGINTLELKGNQNDFKVYLNGELLSSISSPHQVTTGNIPIFLFTQNLYNSSSGTSEVLPNRLIGKIYEFVMGEHTYKPCVRKSDGEVGMYDTFTNTFLTNQGEGKFVRGNTKGLIYAGIVRNSGNISLRPSDPKYCSLQIIGFKTLLSESELLDFVISNKTIYEAIQMVIDKVSEYGFVTGILNITDGDKIIGAYSTLDKSPYDVLQYLAEISQAKWFTRLIGEDLVAIDFYSSDKIPQADDINYTREYFCENKIIDISFNFGTRDYRNRQTILSNAVYGSIDNVDDLISNGYSKDYVTQQKIGIMKEIKVNDVAKSFVTIQDKNTGIYADFYYDIDTNNVTSASTYSAGTNIKITYTPIIQGRIIQSNFSEINRISSQLNRKGIIGRYETRNDVLDINELNEIAKTYIKYKGSNEIILNVKTEDKDLFNIGQQVYFNIQNFQELAKTYMIKSKTIEMILNGSTKHIFYSYELSSSFEGEESINFFDNQRRKNSGNIKPNEFIQRNIDIENEGIIIFENFRYDKYDNLSDYIKQLPLVTQGQGLYHHDGTLPNGINDDSYRYSGANPDNYVKFADDNTLYRIIGVFDNRVKLIRNEEIGGIDWDINDVNDWADTNGLKASLALRLNNEYYNGLSDNTKNKIDNVIWTIAGNTTDNIQKKKASLVYQNEIVNPDTSYTPKTTEAKIGLMYVSDYGFATTPDNWTQTMNNYNKTSLRENDWLYNGGDLHLPYYIQWTITRNAENTDTAWAFFNDGRVVSNGVGQAGVRPVFYLKPSVIVANGTGTENDPYII